jgi:sec-independent protein translocase protein TatB
MFEVGFGELLLIAALALVVLGPERLPKVAQQVGRWVGRARAMARQFREQLEEEVNVEPPRPAPRRPSTPPPTPEPTPAAPEPDPAVEPSIYGASNSQAHVPPEPAPTTDDHFSHAHGDGDAAPVTEPESPPAPPAEPLAETAAIRSEHERGT